MYSNALESRSHRQIAHYSFSFFPMTLDAFCVYGQIVQMAKQAVDRRTNKQLMYRDNSL